LPDLYEFRITGTIGPLIQSSLPGLDTVAESEWTLLTGTAGGPDDLRRILNLLDANGVPALNVRIAPRPAGTGGQALK